MCVYSKNLLLSWIYRAEIRSPFKISSTDDCSGMFCCLESRTSEVVGLPSETLALWSFFLSNINNNLGSSAAGIITPNDAQSYRYGQITIDVQRGKFIVLTSAVANDGDIIVTAVFGFSFGVNFALQEDKDVFLPGSVKQESVLIQPDNTALLISAICGIDSFSRT